MIAVADIRLDAQTVVPLPMLNYTRKSFYSEHNWGLNSDIKLRAYIMQIFAPGTRAPWQFSMPSIAVSPVDPIQQNTSQCPPIAPARNI